MASDSSLDQNLFDRSQIKTAFNENAKEPLQLELKPFDFNATFHWLSGRANYKGNAYTDLPGPINRAFSSTYIEKQENFSTPLINIDTTFGIANLNKKIELNSDGQPIEAIPTISHGIYAKLGGNHNNTTVPSRSGSENTLNDRTDFSAEAGIGYQKYNLDTQSSSGIFAIGEFQTSRYGNGIDASRLSAGLEGLIERPKWDISAAVMAPLSFQQDNIDISQPDPLKRLSANLEYSRLLIGDKDDSALSISAHVGTGDHMTHHPVKTEPSYVVDSSISIEAGIGVKLKF